MADATDDKKLFDLYKLYVDTTETVCARRAEMNKWMLTVNGAVVSLYGYLVSGKSAVPAEDQVGWLIVIPSAGVIICFAWAAMLASYRKLNAAKFSVIHEIEEALPAKPFLREKEVYESLGRRPLSQVERRVPYAFMVLYSAFIAFRLIALFG